MAKTLADALVLELSLRDQNIKEELNKLKSEFSSLKQVSGSVSSNVSNDLNKVEQSASSASAGFGKMEIAATAALAAIAFGLAKVITNFTQFEKTMNMLKAVTGASGAEFEQLKKRAIDLGATTIFTAKEVADTFVLLGQQGLTVAEQMKAVPAVLDAAAASGADLKTTADIIVLTLKGFGLGMENAGRVADILAQSATISAAEMADLGEALKTVGPVAYASGQSLEDVAAVLTVLADRGSKGSEAGTALRGILTRLQDPSRETVNSLNAIGISMEDLVNKNTGKMKSIVEIISLLKDHTEKLTQVERNRVASQVSGLYAFTEMSALMNTSKEQLIERVQLEELAIGSSKKMADTINSGLVFAVDQLSAALESSTIVLGERLRPALLVVIKILTDFVNTFVGASKEMQGFVIGAVAMTGALSGLALAAKIIPPILAALSAEYVILSRNIAVTSAAMNGMTVATKALTLSLTGWQVALGVIAAAGLGGFIVAMNQSETALEKFNRETQNLQNEAAGMSQSLSTEGAAAIKLAQIIDGLIKKTNRSAYENDLLKASLNNTKPVTDALIARFPDLADQIRKVGWEAGNAAEQMKKMLTLEIQAKAKKQLDELDKSVQSTARSYVQAKKNFSNVGGGFGVKPVIGDVEGFATINVGENSIKNAKTRVDNLKKDLDELSGKRKQILDQQQQDLDFINNVGKVEKEKVNTYGALDAALSKDKNKKGKELSGDQIIKSLEEQVYKINELSKQESALEKLGYEERDSYFNQYVQLKVEHGNAIREINKAEFKSNSDKNKALLLNDQAFNAAMKKLNLDHNREMQDFYIESDAQETENERNLLKSYREQLKNKQNFDKSSLESASSLNKQLGDMANKREDYTSAVNAYNEALTDTQKLLSLSDLSQDERVRLQQALLDVSEDLRIAAQNADPLNTALKTMQEIFGSFEPKGFLQKISNIVTSLLKFREALSLANYQGKSSLPAIAGLGGSIGSAFGGSGGAVGSLAAIGLSLFGGKNIFSVLGGKPAIAQPSIGLSTVGSVGQQPSTLFDLTKSTADSLKNSGQMAYDSISKGETALEILKNQGYNIEKITNYTGDAVSDTAKVVENVADKTSNIVDIAQNTSNVANVAANNMLNAKGILESIIAFLTGKFVSILATSLVGGGLGYLAGGAIGGKTGGVVGSIAGIAAGAATTKLLSSMGGKLFGGGLKGFFTSSGGGALTGLTGGYMLGGAIAGQGTAGKVAAGGGAALGTGIGLLAGGPVGAIIGGLIGGGGGGLIGKIFNTKTQRELKRLPEEINKSIQQVTSINIGGSLDDLKAQRSALQQELKITQDRVGSFTKIKGKAQDAFNDLQNTLTGKISELTDAINNAESMVGSSGLIGAAGLTPEQINYLKDVQTANLSLQESLTRNPFVIPSYVGDLANMQQEKADIISQGGRSQAALRLAEERFKLRAIELDQKKLSVQRQINQQVLANQRAEAELRAKLGMDDELTVIKVQKLLAINEMTEKYNALRDQFADNQQEMTRIAKLQSLERQNIEKEYSDSVQEYNNKIIEDFKNTEQSLIDLIDERQRIANQFDIQRAETRTQTIAKGLAEIDPKIFDTFKELKTQDKSSYFGDIVINIQGDITQQTLNQLSNKIQTVLNAQNRKAAV